MSSSSSIITDQLFDIQQQLNENLLNFTINTCEPQSLNQLKNASKFKTTYHAKNKTNTNHTNNKQAKPTNKLKKESFFRAYWSLEDVKKNLKENKLIKSKLRINPRNFKDAYLSDTLNDKNLDIYIDNIQDRNRALNGDIVAAKIKHKSEWKIIDATKINDILHDFIMQNSVKHEQTTCVKAQRPQQSQNTQQLDRRPSLIELTCSCFYINDVFLDLLNDQWFQKTAYVVFILDKKHTRFTAGHLKLITQNQNIELFRNKVLFSPKDSRLPRLLIDINECPSDFKNNSKFYEKTLFIAEIIEMPDDTYYALGQLKSSIGELGDINAETEAILFENGIDSSEFDDDLIKNDLPQIPWSIPAHEYTYRRDLRDQCIFTIDPATARDLDDALHCIKLNENLYEVGVHIADVSHFVVENSYIDQKASERTTSVYLVQKVIPMLPRMLCENLCSLNPNEERLTFSVIWQLNENGEILSEWFGRTIIKSCVKLSYEHAQMIIEGQDENDTQKFPSISERFSLSDVKESVMNMFNISKKLRAKRYSNGCLALNQIKLCFLLNNTDKMPFAYNVYEQKDSNRLVEEFMLLANIAVAKHVYDKFPKKAILRRHPAPNTQQILQLADSLKEYGYVCDISTSNSIQNFLHELENQNTPESRIAFITLTCMLTKTMQLAQYFCSGSDNITKENYSHYGLAVPLYTHFTSPIRRYPDILVHRLLAASLDYCQLTRHEADNLQIISELCNDKKYAARICSEKSSELYFSLFVNECGPLEEQASVIIIKDHSFDVLINNLGITKRIYCDKLDIKQDSIQYLKNDAKSELKFTWNASSKHGTEVQQTIKLFDKVNVILTKSDSSDNDPLKYNVILKHPNDHKAINANEGTLTSESTIDDTSITQQRIDVDPYIFD